MGAPNEQTDRDESGLTDMSSLSNPKFRDLIFAFFPAGDFPWSSHPDPGEEGSQPRKAKGEIQNAQAGLGALYFLASSDL